ncbi:MAG: alpha/beta hydrolase [bacterium]|nr:alpha/beta hydrolase [bacterium]
MSPDLGPAARIAGRGLAAAGVLAIGAALGAVAERTLLRTAIRMPIEDTGVEFGSLRGDVHIVPADDGTLLHIEVDEAPGADSLTVVFCHGYALNLDSWHYQRQAFRGKARLVFYDQRSHGRSGRAEFDSHHIDQLGRDLASVIDAVASTGPLLLVGHSMGGMSIMAFAEQRPEVIVDRVFGVALISTTAGGVNSGLLGLPPFLGSILQRLAAPVATAVARQKSLVERSRWSDSDLGLLLTRMYSFGSATPDEAGRFVAAMVAATPIDVIAEFLPAIQAHDKNAALGLFQSAELLVVVGSSDRLTPREQSDEIVKHVPGAEYVVIPEAGHMVTVERPELVNDALLALLDRVRRDVAGHAVGGAA